MDFSNNAVAIFGAGQFGRRLYLKLEAQSDIVYFVDNAKREEMRLPVICPFELQYRWSIGEIDTIIVAVSDYYAVGDIVLELKNLGIDRCVIADPQLWKKYWEKGLHCDTERFLYPLDIERRAVLTKLEFHVCDHCNLNCVGCAHFAPLYHNVFADVKAFKQDVQQLSKLFENIFRFRLMGGEPLLHENLDEFIKVTRRYFPHTRLEIVTNGLLLPRVSPSTWEVIRKNGAVLNISLYPPTFRVKGELEELLAKRRIDYSFGSGLEQYNEDGIIEEFHKNLTTGNKHNPVAAAARCMGDRCHFLRNGQLSKCAIPLLAEDVNRAFGTTYETVMADIIDIFDETIAPWDMVRRLHYATPFCAYCSEVGTERFKWQTGRESMLEDFVRS